MLIKAIGELIPEEAVCHDGEGKIKMSNIFDKELTSALQHVHYTVLPPGTSIGVHTHKHDEELYIILDGIGIMEIEGQKTPVRKGHAILNPPFGTHALYNISDTEELKILVIGAECL